MNGITHLDRTEEVALITLEGIPAQLGLISDIFGEVASQEINIDMITQSAPAGHKVDLSFTCRGNDLVKVLSLIKTISGKHPGIRPLVVSDNCKLQLFGEEMREMHGVFARVIEAIRDIPLELRLITTSEVDISLLIDSAHTEDAVSSIVKAFSL